MPSLIQRQGWNPGFLAAPVVLCPHLMPPRECALCERVLCWWLPEVPPQFLFFLGQRGVALSKVGGNQCASKEGRLDSCTAGGKLVGSTLRSLESLSADQGHPPNVPGEETLWDALGSQSHVALPTMVTLGWRGPPGRGPRPCWPGRLRASPCLAEP